MSHAEDALTFGCDPHEGIRRNVEWALFRDANCADWTPRDEARSKAAFFASWNARGDQRCNQCRD